MSWTKQYTLWCDSCNEWVQLSVRNLKRAEGRARDRGWTAPPTGEHYCPDCAYNHD